MGKMELYNQLGLNKTFVDFDNFDGFANNSNWVKKTNGMYVKNINGSFFTLLIQRKKYFINIFIKNNVDKVREELQPLFKKWLEKWLDNYEDIFYVELGMNNNIEEYCLIDNSNNKGTEIVIKDIKDFFMENPFIKYPFKDFLDLTTDKVYDVYFNYLIKKSFNIDRRKIFDLQDDFQNKFSIVPLDLTNIEHLNFLQSHFEKEHYFSHGMVAIFESINGYEYTETGKTFVKNSELKKHYFNSFNIVLDYLINNLKQYDIINSKVLTVEKIENLFKINNKFYEYYNSKNIIKLSNDTIEKGISYDFNFIQNIKVENLIKYNENIIRDAINKFLLLPKSAETISYVSDLYSCEKIYKYINKNTLIHNINNASISRLYDISKINDYNKYHIEIVILNELQNKEIKKENDSNRAKEICDKYNYSYLYDNNIFTINNLNDMSDININSNNKIVENNKSVEIVNDIIENNEITDSINNDYFIENFKNDIELENDKTEYNNFKNDIELENDKTENNNLNNDIELENDKTENNNLNNDIELENDKTENNNLNNDIELENDKTENNNLNNDIELGNENNNTDINSELTLTNENNITKYIKYEVLNYISKTSYHENEPIDYSDLVVIGYINETDFDIIDIKKIIKVVNENTITYNIDGYIFTQSINYIAKKEELFKIIKNPDKTTYIEGQIIDLKGLVTLTKYTDNSIILKTDKDYKQDKEQKLTLNNNSYFIESENNVGLIDLIIIPRKIVKMEIIKEPIKTTYIENQIFDKTGLELKAYYNDNSEEFVTDFIYLKNNLKINDTFVELVYKDFSIKQKINVIERKKELLKIEKEPLKLVYVEGQSFDNSELEVKAIYNDKTEELIKDYTYSNDNLTLNDSFIIIQHENLSVKLNITVIPRIIEKIVISKMPLKLSYIEEQSFDTTGLEIKALYNDNTEEFISNYNINKNILRLEDKFVIVEYENKTVNIDITVIKKIIISLEIVKKPIKTIYIEDECFDTTGLEIKAIYNDNTDKIITDYIYNSEPLTLNTEYIIISKDNYEIKQKIEVKEKTLVNIYIDNKIKSTYIEGQSFNKDDIIVKGKYNNNKDYIIKDYTYNLINELTLNDNQIEIQYLNKTVILDITVIQKEIIRFIIEQLPNLEYIETQKFDLSGSVLKAELNNGQLVNIPYNQLTIVSGGIDLINLTNDIVILKYSGTDYKCNDSLDIKFNIIVIPRVIISIGILKNANKMQYVEGQFFNSDGLEIKALFNDNTEETLDNVIIENKQLFLNDNKIKITYNNFTTYLDVTVCKKTVIGIAITKEPESKIFIENQSLDKNSIEVMSIFNDSTMNIENDYSIIPEILTVNDTEVKIVKENKYAIISNIIVEQEKETAIEIINYPTKMQYFKGDEIILDGLEIAIVYNSKRKQHINNYITKIDSETGIVDICYNDFTTSFNIEFLTIEPIQLKLVSKKDTYIENENILKDDIKVELIYNNGDIKECNDFIIDTDIITLDTNEIILHYSDLILSVPIKVIEKDIIDIQIKKNACKYYEQNLFRPTDIIVMAIYNNGQKEEIKDYNYKKGYLTKEDNIFKIIYKQFEKTIELNIKDRYIEKINFKQLPNKILYTTNDMFNPDGTILEVFYNNNTTEIITDLKNVIIDDSTFKDGIINFTYKNFSVTLNIQVVEKKIVKLEKVNSPNCSYIIDKEKLLIDTLIFKAIYNTNEEECINFKDKNKFEYKIDLEKQKLMILYENFDISYDLDIIKDKAVSLEITKKFKNNYYEGDYFNLNDIELRVIYLSETSKIITDFNFEPKRKLKLKDEKIKINYNNLKLEYSIKVLEKEEKIEEEYNDTFYIKNSKDLTIEEKKQKENVAQLLDNLF